MGISLSFYNDTFSGASTHVSYSTAIRLLEKANLERYADEVRYNYGTEIPAEEARYAFSILFEVGIHDEDPLYPYVKQIFEDSLEFEKEFDEKPTSFGGA